MAESKICFLPYIDLTTCQWTPICFCAIYVELAKGPKVLEMRSKVSEIIRHALSVPTNDDTTRWLMVSGRLNPDESHSNMFVNQMRSPKSLGESVTQ